MAVVGEQLKWDRLHALGLRGSALGPALEMAIAVRDLGGIEYLTAELTTILRESAQLLVELGMGGERLQFLQVFAAERGINLGDIIPTC